MTPRKQIKDMLWRKVKYSICKNLKPEFDTHLNRYFDDEDMINSEHSLWKIMENCLRDEPTE